MAVVYEKQRMSVDYRVRLQDCLPCGILENLDLQSPRQASIDFVDSITLHERNLAGTEVDIAQEASKQLTALSNPVAFQVDRNVYQPYAACDILNGLGNIDHPATQHVIAENLDFPDGSVAARAENLLRRQTLKVYPETLTYLLSSPNPNRRDLALTILRDNPTAGHEGDVILPEVYDNLEMLLSHPDNAVQRQTAIIVSLLHERTNKKYKAVRPGLFEKAQSVLVAHMEHIVQNLSTQAAFDHAVERVVTEPTNANISNSFLQSGAADKPDEKKTMDEAILVMPIALPKEISAENEAKALTVLATSENTEEQRAEIQSLSDYRMLTSLIRTTARNQFVRLVHDELTHQERVLKAAESARKTDAEAKETKVKSIKANEEARRKRQEDEATNDAAQSLLAKTKFKLVSQDAAEKKATT